MYLKSFVLLLKCPGINGIYQCARQRKKERERFFVFVFLSQWLSEGAVLPPAGHWTTSEDIFGCHRDAGAMGRGHRSSQTSYCTQLCPPKSLFSPKCVNVEKSCKRLWLRLAAYPSFWILWSIQKRLAI